MTAPIPIIALGFWGARWREENWPTQPSIVECRVRPATPLEISQGANIGVTVRAVVPMKPNSCPGLKYTLASQKIRWEENHSLTESNRTEFESTYAYSWKQNANQPPYIAEAELYSVCGGMNRIAKKFALSGKGLPLPDIGQARQFNFRVSKVILAFWGTKGRMNAEQELRVSIEDVVDETFGLMTYPQCVGNWTVQKANNDFSAKAHIGTTSGNGNQTVEVTVKVDFGKTPQMPKPGAKIRGQLSINRGWPQEITVEWPEKLSENSALTELEFSTKLAPLPK